MNAPRAFPTWSGPVGLADTNSTLTERGRIGATRPHAGGSARMPAIVASSAPSSRRMFRKPGAATSAEATGVEAASAVASATSSAASASAIAVGAIRYGRASRIARLLAKSPWTGSAGRSTSTAGRTAPSGQAGNAPPATARSHAPLHGGTGQGRGWGARCSAGSSACGRSRDSYPHGWGAPRWYRTRSHQGPGKVLVHR